MAQEEFLEQNIGVNQFREIRTWKNFVRKVHDSKNGERDREVPIIPSSIISPIVLNRVVSEPY